MSEPHPHMRVGQSTVRLRHGGAVWWVIIAGTLLQGCGLPTIPFLAPPINPDFRGINEENFVLTFEHNPDNDDDDFRGYDLYYKLYTTDDDESVRSDESFIETTPVEPGDTRLVQRGFVRMVTVAELQPSNPSGEVLQTVESQSPHLPTSPTESSIEYSIDVSDPGSVSDPTELNIVVMWQQAGEQARGFRRRNVREGTTSEPLLEFESFFYRAGYTPGNAVSPNVSEPDYDIDRMQLDDAVEDQLPDQLRIVVYVLAYGIDTNFNEYRSEPIRLEPAVLVLQ